MNIPCKNPLALASLAMALMILVGCDAAEQSAQKLAEEAKKEAQALLENSVGEVVDEVNRQVDAMQESTNRALGKDDKEREQDAETPRVAPDKPLEQGVET
ncbi:hypothetical protein [Ectopseudomonas composti]|jgi:hypothetical protein|uniref:hypothetical protein n=1 Tax=Ectopseudomonas composti TaxID=658457 RepID=UPI000773EF68|nr:hypothetical protein [Pseudomonas composti]